MLRSSLFLAALLMLAACDASSTAPTSVPPTPQTSVAPETPAPSVIQAIAPQAIPELASTDTNNLIIEVVHLGRMIVRVERTPMAGVQSDIGAGQFDEMGDGADFRSWLCYTAPGAQRIWLTSTGASGEFVTGFELVNDPSAQPTPHCPALPAQYSPIVLEPDMHLGTPLTQIERMFGAAEQRDGWRQYQHTRAVDHGGLITHETHTLNVQIANGRVTGIAASKATTD